ncbi:hypothetical protein B0T20DRAFT_401685 [Sordaria brevicollis]|uniref:Uncharacterized protein n=1 Tax=Sordaria brevicollis TaxID=83679 RepID=A0AAE0PJY6_SORBR|nr:hypothetical protein B0T20DRAFT_401685 [Sordaria brevicollis]
MIEHCVFAGVKDTDRRLNCPHGMMTFADIASTSGGNTPYVRFNLDLSSPRRQAHKCADDAKKDPVLRDKPLLTTCQFEPRTPTRRCFGPTLSRSTWTETQPRHRVRDGVAHFPSKHSRTMQMISPTGYPAGTGREASQTTTNNHHQKKNQQRPQDWQSERQTDRQTEQSHKQCELNRRSAVCWFSRARRQNHLPLWRSGF